MFTGLIKDIGKIISITENESGKEFIIKTKLISEIGIDDSVAINGTCLTATEINNDSFKMQAVHVTLEKTNLGNLKIGQHVNLELALRPVDRLGGHFVQGHVNGVGEFIRAEERGGNYEIWISLPENLRKYTISEGSIALDGISLTIAAIENENIMVSIIPHTWEFTNLSERKPGDIINIEVDMLAKYVEQFVNPHIRANASITEFIQERV